MPIFRPGPPRGLFGTTVVPPGKAPPAVVLRSPMRAPQFAPAPIQQGWSTNLLLTTLALPAAAAFAWQAFQVPQAPPRLVQSWVQPTPLALQQFVTPAQPVGQGTDSRLPIARTPIPQSWAQGAIQNPYALPPGTNSDWRVPPAPTRSLQFWLGPTSPTTPALAPPNAWQDFRLPTIAAPIKQRWIHPTPLSLASQTVILRAPMQAPWRTPAPIQQSWSTNLLQSTLAAGPPAFIFRSPMQAPMRLHWNRDRSSMSFELTVYAAQDAPTNVVLRDPLKAPQFAPYRMPQQWTQGISLSLSQQKTVLRQPMQAPQFAPTRINQSWTQNLLASTLSLPSAANYTAWRVPIYPPRLMQTWTQGIPIGISLAMFPDGFYDAWTVPIAAPRMPQSWTQGASLGLKYQTVVTRSPLQAPMFGPQLYAWRQAYNPQNLNPQQAANPPAIRYHVIGSFVVRRYK